MKKLFYSLLLFASASLFAQKNTLTKFAVANDVIGTVEMFTTKGDILQGKGVVKTKATLPQNLKKYAYLADNGLTEYKFKKGYEGQDRLTVAQINENGNLPSDTPVFIDGYEFKNPETKIYAEILNNRQTKEENGKKFFTYTTK